MTVLGAKLETVGVFFDRGRQDNSPAIEVEQAQKQSVQISPQQGDQLNQRALQVLVGNASAENIEEASYPSEEMPEIRPPLNGSLTDSAKALKAMMESMQMDSELSSQKLAQLLERYQAQTDSRIKQAGELSQELENLSQQFNAAYAQAEAAGKQLKEDALGLQNAQQKLMEAENKLGQASQQGDLQLIATAKQEVEAAKRDLQLKTSALEASRANFLVKLNVAQNISDTINAKTNKMQGQYGNISSEQLGGLKTAQEHAESTVTNLAFLLQILAEFIEKVGEAATQKLQSDLKRNNQLAVARQAEMQRKSDEYEEQMRKAQEAQRIAATVSKAVGIFMIGLGALTTIFGGGGLALMAIGIALMVADPIMQAITGRTLTGMVMDPLMEHVIMPMIEEIGKVVTAILDKTGLGKLMSDEAKMIVNTVVALVVMAAIVIVIGMVAKSAVKFMVDKMAKALSSAAVKATTDAVLQTIKKIMPNILKKGASVTKEQAKMLQDTLKQLIQQGSKRISDSKVGQQYTKVADKAKAKMGNTPEERSTNMRMLANYTQLGGTTLETTGIVTSGTLNVVGAELGVDAAHSISDVELSRTETRILQKNIEQIMQILQESMMFTGDLTETMASIQENAHDTGLHVVSRMRMRG